MTQIVALWILRLQVFAYGLEQHWNTIDIRKSSEVHMDDIFALAATQIKKAETALFLTGAGMSADSGLPTYSSFVNRKVAHPHFW